MALIMIRKINTPALLEGDLFYSDVLAEKKKKITLYYYLLLFNLDISKHHVCLS